MDGIDALFSQMMPVTVHIDPCGLQHLGTRGGDG
jgi:hypothetical protein